MSRLRWSQASAQWLRRRKQATIATTGIKSAKFVIVGVRMGAGVITTVAANVLRLPAANLGAKRVAVVA